MKNTISIDFGTTRTKMAYFDPNKGSVELARLGHKDHPFIPSLFFLRADGQHLYGDEAAEYLDSEPLGFLHDPLKRKLREATVRAGNRVIATPTGLLTLMFSGLRAKTSEISCFRQNPPPTAIRLTVPVQYGPPDRRILTEAAQRAGFQYDSITLIDEPVAAAQAWLADQGGDDEYIVVLDCGGGTLDWACLHRGKAGRFEIIPELPAGGDNRIGGLNIDEELLSLIEDTITDESSRQLLQSERCTFLELIRRVKEGYSKTGDGNKIKVGNQNIEITANFIDDVISRRYIDQTCQSLLPYIEKVRDRLKLANPTVLLVGGSARLRGLKEAITKQCKCNAIWWERSEFATVLGAGQPSTHEKHAQSNISAVVCHKRDDAKSEAFITDQMKRHETFQPFLREMLRLQWRLSNSVWTSANNLNENLLSIQEGEDKKRTSLKVRQGLENVVISDFDEIVKLASSGFVEMVSAFIEDLPERHIRLFPALEPFRDRFIFPVKCKSAIVNDVARDLRKLKKDFSAIEDSYQQLAEFYPRYDDIMSRAGWMDWIIGGAVGFFTGGLGIAAAAIWGGWRGMNDDQFLKHYYVAVQDFINACLKFNECGELILSAHIQRVNDVWIDTFKPMAEMYRALAEKGQDLEFIERKARKVDHVAKCAYSSGTNQFIACIVGNLKQDANLSKRSLENIILDLRSSGFLLTESGDLDEAAVAALPPDEETKFLMALTSDVMSIIQCSSCCSTEHFHVAPDIPEEKLSNAIKAYGHGCHEHNVLCLYDETLFGSGDEGFIVTLGGIWWTGQNAKNWTEIKTIASAKDSNAVKVDGDLISIEMESESLTDFVSLIKKVRNCVVKHLPVVPNT